MNLRIYTLSVCLAAIIGLIVAIAPLVRSVLEYRSPQFVEPNAELASLETFVLAKSKIGISEEMYRTKLNADKAGMYVLKFWERGEWEAMYEAEKTQHIQGIRSKATRDLAAYGTLCLLCIGLLVTHLQWARRLERRG